MNYAPNTTQWKKGDVVVHDADAKTADMLMGVVGYNDEGLCRTYYLNPHHQKQWGPVRCSRLLNRVMVLHSPDRFNIPLPGRSIDNLPPRPLPPEPEGWSRCCTCHYQWRTGQDGSHSCAEHLARSERRARGKLAMIQQLQAEGMPEPWRTRVCDILANGMDRGAAPWPLGRNAIDHISPKVD